MFYNLVAGKLHEAGTNFRTSEQNRHCFVQFANQEIKSPLLPPESYKIAPITSPKRKILLPKSDPFYNSDSFLLMRTNLIIWKIITLF